MPLVLEEKRVSPVAKGATQAEAECLEGHARQPSPALLSPRHGESQTRRLSDPPRPICDAGGEGRVGRLREWLSRHKQRRARRCGWTKGFVSTGLERLDAALPNGGVPNGAVTEIYSEAPGIGSLTLAMRIAARSTLPSFSAMDHHPIDRSSNRQSTIDNRQFLDPLILATASPRPRSLDPFTAISRSLDPLAVSRSIVFIDTWGDFYPPAVAPLGIDPESLIVIRSVRQRDAFWAVDQCLRCLAVAAVIAPLSRLDERESRRLQLAAESSGAIGLLLCPGQPRSRTFAAVRMLVESVNRRSIAARGDLRGASTLDNWQFAGSLTEMAAPRHGESETLRSRFSLPDFSLISRSSPRRVPDLDPRHGESQTLILSSLRRFVASSLCKITLLSVREGMPADPFVVDLHHATGACDLSSIPGHRPAAKIG